MTTFRKLKGSIIEEVDTAVEEGEVLKDKHDDVDEEDKKSVTEEDVKEAITEKEIEEEKKAITAKDVEKEKSITEEDGTAIAVKRNEIAAITKPTPLPRTIK